MKKKYKDILMVFAVVLIYVLIILGIFLATVPTNMPFVDPTRQCLQWEEQ